MENTASSGAQAEPDDRRRSGRKAEKPWRYKERTADCPVAGRKAMKKASAKAQTIPDVCRAFEAVAKDTATALDCQAQLQPGQKAACLDALITVMQAAVEQHGPREAVVRRRLRYRMCGLALSVADKADVEACAVASDAHCEAASAARRLSTELEAERRLCVQRFDGLAALQRAIDLLQDEVMCAPECMKQEMSTRLREMMRDAADLQLREREGQIFCEVTEIKMNEAYAELSSSHTAIQQLMASVPRPLRQKGVVAALLGNGWAA